MDKTQKINKYIFIHTNHTTKQKYCRAIGNMLHTYNSFFYIFTITINSVIKLSVRYAKRQSVNWDKMLLEYCFLTTNHLFQFFQNAAIQLLIQTRQFRFIRTYEDIKITRERAKQQPYTVRDSQHSIAWQVSGTILSAIDSQICIMM